MNLNVKNVVTLIAPKGKLSQKRVDEVSKSLADSDATITGTDWLAKDEACDIFFQKLEIKSANKILEKITDIDFIAQPVEGRKKKLLISDMDSTIITIECIDELADFAGLKEKISVITERAMNGELDFKEALRERVKLLAGLSENALQQTYDQRLKFMPGAKKLVQTMRKNGAYCLLVSGGFTFFTSRVKDEMGFHEDDSNILNIKDGSLTGTVKEPILDKAAKLEALNKKVNELKLDPSATMAVGDGANDLPMLLSAGLGVAYHAKPAVKSHAKAKIDVCDLTALLYAQGYHATEIVDQ